MVAKGIAVCWRICSEGRNGGAKDGFREPADMKVREKLSQPTLKVLYCLMFVVAKIYNGIIVQSPARLCDLCILCGINRNINQTASYPSMRIWPILYVIPFIVVISFAVSLDNVQ